MIVPTPELLVKLGFTDSNRQAKTWVREGAVYTYYAIYGKGQLWPWWERVGQDYNLEYRDIIKVGHRSREVPEEVYDYFIGKYEPEFHKMANFCRTRNPVVKEENGVITVGWDAECDRVCVPSLDIICQLYKAVPDDKK